ncbi:MAG: MBL fold metallo-hydrolase [Minisyncoccia bacterium]
MLEKSKKYYLLVSIFILFATNIFLFHLDRQNSHRMLTFAMLDVGQGDAIFIESPTGTQVMFDIGGARKILGPFSKLMSPFDRTIDAVFITNPDADHIGGFPDIFKNYKVGVVFESGTLNDSKTFQNLKTEIKNQNIPNILAQKGMRIHIGGGALIDILFPDRDVSSWTTNDGSIVARLTYGDNSIMLTGDSTTKTEKVILSENSKEQLQSTFLKVGHHGSRTSTSFSFVKTVSPKYALISVGKENKYGHPHTDTLATLTQSGAKILRTDLLGTIIIKCVRMGVCETN